MEIPLLQGRDVNAGDTERRPRVAIVNEAFVRRFLPGDSPIGRTFVSGNRTIEVIGLARDAAYATLREAVPPTIYVPIRQEPATQVNFTLRTAGDPAALMPALRTAVREIDANLPIFAVRTQEEQVTQLVAQERLFAWLSAFLGSLALMLTCIGLYGLLAHQVTAHTREIGIRMALGAQRFQAAFVLRQTTLLTMLGVATGLIGAATLSRYLEGMLFGLTPLDLPTFVAVVVMFVVVAMLASYVPARRATRVDPLVALRTE
jgi:predicted permease